MIGSQKWSFDDCVGMDGPIEEVEEEHWGSSGGIAGPTSSKSINPAMINAKFSVVICLNYLGILVKIFQSLINNLINYFN